MSPAKIAAASITTAMVLAMTADTSASDRARYLADGLDGYLAKPLTSETVIAALGPHLRPASPKV